MGFPLSVLKLLVKQNKSFTGLALTYGVQGITAQYRDVLNILSENHFSIIEVPENERLVDQKTQQSGFLHQKTFFRMLGFENVESIDIISNEGADYIQDLNFPIHNEFKNRYDFIYDGGTLEHCFNVASVLENTVKLLKTEGMILHATTISGWINHGYYQFSPILFFDFYSKNGFECQEFKLIIDDKYYVDGVRDYLKTDFAGAKVISFFTAVKKEEIKKITYPIQRPYKEYKYIHEFFNPQKMKYYKLKNYVNNMIQLKTFRILPFALKEL